MRARSEWAITHPASNTEVRVVRTADAYVFVVRDRFARATFSVSPRAAGWVGEAILADVTARAAALAPLIEQANTHCTGCGLPTPDGTRYGCRKCYAITSCSCGATVIEGDGEAVFDLDGRNHLCPVLEGGR